MVLKTTAILLYGSRGLIKEFIIEYREGQIGLSSIESQK